MERPKSHDISPREDKEYGSLLAFKLKHQLKALMLNLNLGTCFNIIEQVREYRVLEVTIDE